MKKYMLFICFLFILGGVAYHFFSTWVTCFAGGGGTTIVPAQDPEGDKVFRPGLRMIRTAGEGCLTGLASDAYKNVTCGYRNSGNQNWNLGKIEIKSDTASLLVVECVIPPPGSGITIEYYFEYLAWENPVQRVTFSQDLK